MRILLLSHAFNSLTQRLFVELRDLGHEVSVEFDINDAVTVEAVDLYQPHLIIAPFLKRPIPESIWQNKVCLVVHPGIVGDRGPSALDWAILNSEKYWGVTVLQANAEMDGGDIWASGEFKMRDASKASLYRNEVTTTAVACVLTAVSRFEAGDFIPEKLDYEAPGVRGKWRPLVQQSDRVIDWQKDDTAMVVRKIRSADGYPGVRDTVLGRECLLFDAHPAPDLKGEPGKVIAQRGGAICKATRDGSVWIGHLRDKQSTHPFKLPAVTLLEKELSQLTGVPAKTGRATDIWYEEKGKVGFIHFPFYNGAMGTDQCKRLRQAYLQAKTCDTRVIMLMGGPDYWSNGMHLNLIEAAESAAEESWRNINAMDDLAREIIETDTHLTVAALQGNAGAGGVFLARATDQVWARAGIILNPHYKDMGNLFGSEYWTYLLPRFAGPENAERITQARLPMGTKEAMKLGLVDRIIPHPSNDFLDAVSEEAARLAQRKDFLSLLEQKKIRQMTDEQQRPLQSYRDAELERMRLNFYGFDTSYHIARYNFVYKVPKSRTPLTIASHRRNAVRKQGMR